jgi:zinc protease
MTLSVKLRRGVFGLVQSATPLRATFVRAALTSTIVAVSLLAAPVAQAAKIQRVVSPGGIVAWLEEEHAVPLVTMSFGFKGGNTQDPPGKEGLANLMTALFDEGAADMDGQTFQSKEEDLSMQMSFNEERDGFYGQFKALSENRDASFELLAAAVAKPRFADEAVERMRREIDSQVRNEQKNPDALAGNAFAKLAFAGHPYGRPADGTVDTLKGLTRADLVDYYTRVFAKDGLKIGVVGDIDAATLGPLLDKVFGSLPDHQKLTDPDFMAAYLMNHILGGGGFSSWLYREVREKRGLAYSVDTELLPRQHTGLWIGGVGTRGEKAAESLDIIRQQVKRMVEQGPTQTELDEAKDFVIGSYGLRFDTSEKIAGQLLAVQIDNLGIDYFDRRNAEVKAVTLDQVKAAAKKYLSGDMTVVTVGPKS